MIEKEYTVKIQWTGNLGKGTKNYNAYSRDHTISGEEKSVQIHASSAPSYMGDKTKFNPKDLIVSSVASCHMLSYLHQCTINKLIVTDYSDTVTGIITEMRNGLEKIKEITLNPIVTVEKEEMVKKAADLHYKANKNCFIVNSCNFKVRHNATILVKE